MDRFIYANPVSYKKFKEDKNMSKTIATQIAEAAVNTKFENLSEDAVLHAKTLTLDVLASMVGTRNIISSEIAREIAEEMGGPEEATIVGAPFNVMDLTLWMTITNPTHIHLLQPIRSAWPCASI